MATAFKQEEISIKSLLNTLETADAKTKCEIENTLVEIAPVEEKPQEDEREEVNETIEVSDASDYFMTAESVKAFASADAAYKAIFGDSLKLTAKWYKDGNALSVKVEISGAMKTELNVLGVTAKTDMTIEAKSEAKANEYGLITYEYSYSKIVDNSGSSPVTTISESKIEISWSK